MRLGPRFPGDMGYVGLRMNAEEFLALGETPDRYELIRGVVVGVVTVPIWHNEIIAEVASQVCFWRGSGAPLRVFPSTPLCVSRDTVYRPDLCAYRAGRLADTVETLDSPPDLIVEILSHDTKALDLFTKYEDYQTFGVGEYWTVDSETGELTVRVGEGPVTEGAAEPVPLARSAPGFTLAMDRIRSLSRRQTRVRF